MTHLYTGNTLGFLLYNLATNPSKQDKVREELMQFGETLSPKDVDKLKYLSACMKESQRVTPTVNGMSRILDRDIEVAGKLFSAAVVRFSSFTYFSYPSSALDQQSPLSFIWVAETSTLRPCKLNSNSFLSASVTKMSEMQMKTSWNTIYRV